MSMSVKRHQLGSPLSQVISRVNNCHVTSLNGNILLELIEMLGEFFQECRVMGTSHWEDHPTPGA